MSTKLDLSHLDASRTNDGYAALRPVDGPRITRRVNLPSGRAVVGALLIAIAALGAYLAARPDASGPSASYLVAARDLTVGEVIESSDLTLVPIDLPPELAATAWTSSEPLVGAVTLGPIGAGELVQSHQLADPGPGDNPQLQVTLPVDTRHAPPQLAPGERVSVLATVGSGADAQTTVTVADATVVAYRTDDGSLGVDTAVLTIAVADQSSVIAVTTAAHSADVTVVRTTGAGPMTGVIDGFVPTSPTLDPVSGGPDGADSDSADSDGAGSGKDDGS